MVDYQRCRTCGENKYSEQCTLLHTIHHPDYDDIKSTIIFCIPQMSEKFSRDDNICQDCLIKLDITYKFIKKCLEVQDRFNEIDRCEFLENKIELIDRELHIVDIKKVEEQDDSKNSGNPEVISVEDWLEKNEKNTLHYKESERNSVNESVSKGISDNISLIPLTCNVCLKTFKSMKKYKEHKKEHITERDYLESCTKCKLTFYESKDFEQHFQLHHPETNLQKCEKCGAWFLYSITYQKHRQKYINTKSCRFECERCNKVFLTKAPYIKHLSMAECTSSCESKRCSICYERFTKKYFNKHCKIHQKNAFVCEQCGKSFATKSRLTSHKRCHNDPNTCICPYCGKGCKSSAHLSSHLKRHAKTSEKEQLSIEETHKLVCDLCPKRFNKKYRLESHRKQHLNIRDYSCDQCNKTFCTRGALTTHQRLSHLGIKPFSCNVCGKTFGRKDYLRYHVSLHTGEPRLNRKKQLVKPIKILDSEGMSNNSKPGSSYTCKVCKKSFKMLCLLKVHYQAHINLRTHKCQHCELSFVNRSSVNKHEKLHKDPTYKFRCSICFKRKTSEEELAEHMAIHTKKPYKCSVCSETFARQYLMENHITNTHSEEVEEKSRELISALNDVATGS